MKESGILRPDIVKTQEIKLFALLFVLAGSCAAQRSNQPSTTDDYYQSVEERERQVSVGSVGNEDEPSSPESMPVVLVRRSPTSNGPLAGEVAGAVIYENVTLLETCYASIGSESAGRGVVYVLLDVEPQGEVDGVLIGYSDVANTRFIECLSDALGSLTMPAATDRSVVQAHLVFGAGNQDEGREMMRSYRASRTSQSEAASEPVPLTAVRQGVQGCYERVFRGHGGQGGRLVLELTLEEGGQIASVRFAEDDFDGRLDQCVMTVVEKLRLEVEEETGTSIVYPVIISHEPSGRPVEASSP